MKYVLGIDPGKDGALALLSDDALFVYRMPVVRTVVGRGRRDRVDPHEVWALMLTFTYVDLVIIEGVGGRPKQSASAAFTFGFSTALPYMAAVACGLKIETVQPHVWKRWMKLPPKTDKQSLAEIMQRAEERFPNERGQFYTRRGRALDGCAEAALMAAWGREQILKEGRYVGHVADRLMLAKRVW